METLTYQHVLFVARIILGSVMVYYGWRKISKFRSNIGDFRMMGFAPAALWGTVIMVNEFFGGLAMVSGLYAEVFAATFGFQMLMGTLWKRFKVHKDFPDYSYDMLAFAVAFLIVAQGSGLWAARHFDAASIALRWEVALAGIGAASLGALVSRPKMPRDM